MVDPQTNHESWYTYITRGGLSTAFIAFALVLFVLVLSIVAYTPILNLMPGYRVDAARSRENLMGSLMRLDSMERMMNDMMTYNRNIAMIMDGKTPVVKFISNADTARVDRTLVVPSREDSLLRIQMEGAGPYALSHAPATSSLIRAELAPPVEGIIIERFDLRRDAYGVRIAASPDAQIVAVNDGTVVMSIWTPETGSVIEIQHENNLLSVYKNLSQSVVTTGQHVKRGEVIGSNTEKLAGGGEAKIFEFELWQGGKAMDPESLILFQ